MQKQPLKVQATDDVRECLQRQGEAIGGQSANTLAAMILAEFSRVPANSGAIFEALGRIHAEGCPSGEIENGAGTLTAGKRQALPMSR